MRRTSRSVRRSARTSSAGCGRRMRRRRCGLGRGSSEGHLHLLADGETGDRNQWIWWQVNKLTAVDGIELEGTQEMNAKDNEDYRVFPSLAVDPSVTELPPRALGYADEPRRPTRSSGAYATRASSRPA